MNVNSFPNFWIFSIRTSKVLLNYCSSWFRPVSVSRNFSWTKDSENQILKIQQNEIQKVLRFQFLFCLNKLKFSALLFVFSSRKFNENSTAEKNEKSKSVFCFQFRFWCGFSEREFQFSIIGSILFSLSILFRFSFLDGDFKFSRDDGFFFNSIPFSELGKRIFKIS